MIVPVLLFALGLVLLIKGGDWFVDGACGIAKRFHLPEILIGATVVSIGTTLPEVMVSATAAVQGSGEIAYGNAIGSIICNTSLIAALTVAIRPSKINKKPLLIPVCFFFGAAIFYSLVAYLTGYFSLLVGIILLATFAVYMGISIWQAFKNPEKTEEPESLELPEAEAPSSKKALVKEIVLLIVGAALIAVGARLLVDNGTLIAEKLGVPESVIALTFVALGTSLPELVTAITSLLKGHGSLSLGNIIGANLFNLVLVSGVSVALSPFAVPSSSQIAGMNTSLVLEIPLMFGVMLLLTVPALIRGKLSRVQGISLLAIYAAFCVFQFT
ncbi:MAG: calcium/sodium antiporter, partial [Clostridia bacterium]|nr:calcium/sodium antiporter [Clostridia bacterium]